jgi:fructose-1,6-bisphosphatase/inositol monophosphatase family enzyme
MTPAADELYSIDPRVYHARRAAENAADVMMQYYRGDYAVDWDETEHDPRAHRRLQDSPGAIKLEVDLRADRLVRAYLTELYPDLGFVSEESFDPAEMEKPVFWCVDPVCGSMGYYKGTGFFGCSAALVDRETGPVIGALNCPALGISGEAHRPAGRVFHRGTSGRRAAGLSVAVSANMKDKPLMQAVLNELEPALVEYRESIPAKALPTAVGEYDLSFGLPQKLGGGAPKIWDFAAARVFFDVQGKILEDFNGRPHDLTGRSGHLLTEGYIMAADGDLAARCRKALEKAAAG